MQEFLPRLLQPDLPQRRGLLRSGWLGGVQQDPLPRPRQRVGLGQTRRDSPHEDFSQRGLFQVREASSLLHLKTDMKVYNVFLSIVLLR